MIKLGSFQQINPQVKTIRDFQAPLPLSVFYSRRSPQLGLSAPTLFDPGVGRSSLVVQSKDTSLLKCFLVYPINDDGVYFWQARYHQ
jgi:hypothetical protein